MLHQEAVVWVMLWLQCVKGWWSGADEHPALFVRGDSMHIHTDKHTILGNRTYHTIIGNPDFTYKLGQGVALRSDAPTLQYQSVVGIQAHIPYNVTVV